MMEQFGSDAPSEFGTWMKDNVDLLRRKQKLAVYAGGRVEEDERQAVREKVAGLLKKAAEAADVLEAVDWEAGGVAWSGFELSAGDLPIMRSEDPPEGFDEETWAEVQDAVEKLKVTVACAEVGDFVILAAGLGRESIVLAEVPEKSLAAAEPFEFFKEFDAGALLGTTWVSEEIVESLVDWNRTLPLLEGVEAGLKEAEKLRRREEMLKAVGEFSVSLKARESGTATAHLGAVLGGDGVRYETRGGWLGAGLDLASPLEFAGRFAGLEKKLFLQGHWKMQADYVAQGNEQVNAAMKLLRLASAEIMENLARKAEAEDGDPETAEKMARWKRDLLKGIDDIWEGYRDHFAKAFGGEWVLAMDLEGEMIPAVGVDEDVVREGRIPRVALLRPVVKREALAESWEKWNRALTNLFGIVAEAFEQPIPFPDTMTAEKDDLRTYFFPFPFASDDFLPSVSVSDELFILGSSKTLSENVYEATLAGEGEAKAPGFWLDANAEALWAFCEVWIDVYEKREAAKEELEEDDRRREKEREEEALPGIEEGEDAEQVLEELNKRRAKLEAEIEAQEEEVRRLEKQFEDLHLKEGGAPDPAPAEHVERPEPAEDEDEPEAIPTFPEKLQLPEAEVENPLLKDLQEKADEDDERLEGLIDEEELQAQVEELMADEADVDAIQLEGPFSLFELPDADVMRGILEKLRVLRSLPLPEVGGGRNAAGELAFPAGQSVR